MNSDIAAAFRIAADRLRKPSRLRIPQSASADELTPEQRHLGQKRAIDALRFGVQIDREGYNVFVLGPPGSNRHQIAEEFARAQAQTRPASRDWCYVNNFADSERPTALAFPAGLGRAFRDDMRTLIDELRLAIPAAFEDEDYRNQLKAIQAEVQSEVEAQWKQLERKAEEHGIGLLQTPTGFVLAPVRDGKVMADDDFEQLPEPERERIQATIEELSELLERNIERMPELRKKHRDLVKALNRDVAEHAVGLLLRELKQRYQELPDVVDYLQAIQQDIIDNAEQFREPEKSPLPFLAVDASRVLNRYEVNLFVSNSADDIAPVVFEPNPSYHNIIGKVEHRAEMGALVTDFRMVRPGALHRANGGFLIVDAQRILTRPFVWEALKQALMAGEIRIESPGESYGLISTSMLRPEPIPLDVKIVMIGERYLYYLLAAYDSEFEELFKVAADLDDDLIRSDENVDAYAALIVTRIGECELMPFEQEAVEKVIEQLARLAEDSERLSTHVRSLDDLLTQADYWARERGAARVELSDVAKAIDEKTRRLSRMQRRIADAIDRDTLLIDTSGECVGQVNGLSVVEIGEHRFGHPVRITATTRLGSGEVVDIEREVELGGAIHSKGVMILSSALAARYAANAPFSLKASIVFEQTYGGVDGDSASVAELCALLSSLAEVGIRQNIAVTGSVNQLGRVQVVGGINEKIEGFFDVCESRGLDGSHGVIIPADNVKHLMLREDVVTAVKEGRFHVYGVQQIDEALSILTGTSAGERDASGAFEKDSINEKVEHRLQEYAEIRKRASGGGDGDGDDE